jgi:methylene-fatty-acyl-phospholipid synthase
VTPLGGLALATLLLSLERVCYVWAWRYTDSFRAFCARPAVARWGEPVRILELLFYGFKAIQLGVFVGWCWVFGALPFGSRPPIALGAGLALIVAGQTLSFAVFYRLGRVGVFYGTRLGHMVPWCTGFPFSILRHPQYVGTVLSIWGFFLSLRFPAPDWVVLPAIETLYYAIGSRLESDPSADVL